MAARQAILKPPPARPELDRLLKEAQKTPVSDEQLHEQRVSFVFGNAPTNSKITKESARRAADSMRLTA